MVSGGLRVVPNAGAVGMEEGVVVAAVRARGRNHETGWVAFRIRIRAVHIGLREFDGCAQFDDMAPSASAAKAEPAPRATIGDPFEILSVLSVEHEVDVLAQRDGAVMETLKDDGQRVQAGEILAQLDDRTIRAQLDKAKADVDEAQNNVKYNEAELNAKQANYRRTSSCANWVWAAKRTSTTRSSWPRALNMT